MGRMMNFLRGMVTLRAEGLFPERLINLCAQEGVEFWGVTWLADHALRLTTRRRQVKLLRGLAERAGCTVEMEGSRGLPDFMLRFRRRYAFLIGLALSLGAVAFLSRFILSVEVTGNQRVPSAMILSQLRQQGIRPGIYGPSLDRQQAALEVQRGIEDLAWVGINLHGTRLEVIVREEVETPKRVDEEGYFDIVSEADGIITHIEAEQGQAAVEEGDTVLAGEVVISGMVSIRPPKNHDIPILYYQTHARGRAWARTWRTLTAAIPLETRVKDYTGKERHSWSLFLMGRRFRVFGGKEEGTFDRETCIDQAVLPDGRVLPLALFRETRREYRLTGAELDRAEAQRMLERQLLRQLGELVGEDGQTEKTEFFVREEGGLLKVTLQAECREEIGREVPGTVPLPDETVTPEKF